MEELRFTARNLLQQEELALIDLWILYWNHGGDCHPFDFDAFIYEILPFAGIDLNALQCAVTDLVLENIG
ncbi:hypothetical protein [Arthrobacter globiformis]|uniref:hypothetical protein n=1 Tax=Arthrobacter globiformis TaxID=1665 RepID=UPI00278521A8|nr:hypothetical protein [Arthrobacter globiformis]MDQ0867271.1 hypothetical protein [Arthrobacter globiformis]